MIVKDAFRATRPGEKEQVASRVSYGWSRDQLEVLNRSSESHGRLPALKRPRLGARAKGTREPPFKEQVASRVSYEDQYDWSRDQP